VSPPGPIAQPFHDANVSMRHAERITSPLDLATTFLVRAMAGDRVALLSNDPSSVPLERGMVRVRPEYVVVITQRPLITRVRVCGNDCGFTCRLAGSREFNALRFGLRTPPLEDARATETKRLHAVAPAT
jgi:hypothetical protein